MKGMNQFRFNEATMIEIVQNYFQDKFFDPVPTVTSVEWTSVSSAAPGAFIITTNDEERKRS